ncbi:MAG: AAA family ATPase [Candidatus Aminicenantes bacterium]|nr:AAA family ATPase [Candidatus Aminicenantes bacterium]NIM83284.1 AAA family ATPase [Candidatus Aminicenantes bacterium]NIN22655.1 AAA family ATPase [Candidatus Aminicenantes bacterium]NIN46414.1 AAA family ATPase [Candidatus Aminicenantes bacterium]NIN89264.1 AAA family ATPase [Candidatus Aminicenantes bacterium]
MNEVKTSEGSKKNEQEVFITDITIHKVRHLENIHIPLSKDERKHLILTGKNGSGKTSVLESLINRLTKIFKGSLIIGEIPDEPVDAERDISILFTLAEKIHEYINSGHFIISNYRARRQSEMRTPKGLSKVNLLDRYYLPDRPGKEFIQYIVNLKAEKSFSREENDLEAVKNIESWFDMFEKTLKEIFEDPTLRLEFDRKNYNFKILQKDKEPFDFNTLADGYSAFINIVTDLILRMQKHWTKSYDVQGVVLIDELETHLHIDLQKKVFPFLTRFFPRIQFIVTTHSPFILNSIADAVIYDLENRLMVEDLSGYSYDGIVESYFDRDKYSEIIKNKLEKYEQLVAQTQRTEEEEEHMIELRWYLKEIPASLARELKAKFQQVELNRKGKR